MSNSALASSDCIDEESSTATDLKLGHELCKDAEEGLCAGGLAVLSEVGGHLGKFFHRSGLQRLQGLDRRVAVLQKTLWVQHLILSMVLAMRSENQLVKTAKCLLWLWRN